MTEYRITGFFTSDRPLTEDELDTLLFRLETEVQEPNDMDSESTDWTRVGDYGITITDVTPSTPVFPDEPETVAFTYFESDVCIDDFGPFPALVNEQMRWNGWALPIFTLDTVRDIARTLTEHSTGLAFEESNWVIVDDDGVWEGCGAYADEYADPRGTKVAPIRRYDMDWYPIGDGWCWSEAYERRDGCSACGLEFPFTDLTDLTREGYDPAKVYICRDCLAKEAQS